jgi:adenosylcobinamide amidohydrolase
VPGPELTRHTTCGHDRPVLVWRFDEPRLVASTATVGGGLGERDWVLNAQVPLDYDRLDLDAHVAEIAAELGCRGRGTGLLTAAALTPRGLAEDGGVVASATVGVSKPTWAADVDDAVSAWVPGTINVVVEVPVRLSEAALLNAILTATEAKSQALFERGVPGTGTASDAVCITCPTAGGVEPFAGPRSPWGARLARAVHAAVLEGFDG